MGFQLVLYYYRTFQHGGTSDQNCLWGFFLSTIDKFYCTDMGKTLTYGPGETLKGLSQQVNAHFYYSNFISAIGESFDYADTGTVWQIKIKVRIVWFPVFHYRRRQYCRSKSRARVALFNDPTVLLVTVRKLFVDFSGVSSRYSRYRFLSPFPDWTETRCSCWS